MIFVWREWQENINEYSSSLEVGKYFLIMALTIEHKGKDQGIEFDI